VTTLGAAALAVATGLFGEPTALAVAAPVLAAVAMTRVPALRSRLAVVLALLAAGWLGGVVSLAIVDPAAASHLRAALEGRDEPERADTLAAGGAAVARDGVLADTENSPALVLGRGGARGLLGASSEPFALALLFSRIDTPFVAVPDPHGVAGANDRLNKAFPELFRHGAPGYRVVYQNSTWRIYERIPESQNHKH
jgi:hypothetical protein